MSFLQPNYLTEELSSALPDSLLPAECGDPQAGELWLLSWDSRALALALITSVYPGFVRAWPVTFKLATDSHSNLKLTCPEIDAPLALWPFVETGLGTYLLHKKLSEILSPRQIRLIQEYVYDDQPAPLSAFRETENVKSITNSEVIGLFNKLCFIEWPAKIPGQAILAKDALMEAGISPQEVATSLGTTTQEALAIWSGQKVLEPAQNELLCRDLGVGFSEAFKVPNGPEISEIQRPEHKNRIIEFAQSRDISEPEARTLIRDEYALAARAPKSGAVRSRVRAAIDRLLRDANESS